MNLKLPTANLCRQTMYAAANLRRRAQEAPAAAAAVVDGDATDRLGYAKGTAFESGPLKGLEKNAVIAAVCAVLCTGCLIGFIYFVFEAIAIVNSAYESGHK
eukprot:SAG22_NODE_1251_length_5005_cov_22.891154_11_plen_102_part_00